MGIWFALGFLCVLVAAFWVFNAYKVHSLISVYSSDGLTVEATIRKKNSTTRVAGNRGRTSTVRSIDVRLDAPGSTAGTSFRLVTIDQRVTPTIYNSVTIGEKVEVIYLPGDLENTAVFKASTDPENLGWFDRLLPGIFIALLGLLFLSIGPMWRIAIALGLVVR